MSENPVPQGTAPIVCGLFTAARAGSPMESHRQVDLLPGVGVVGDRYAARLGHWSDPRWPDQELTLIEAEVAEDLEIDVALLRRNIVTQNLRLASLIGRTFQIADTVLVGVRPCDPCRYLEGLTRTGLARRLVDRGGLRAKIVQGGRIHVADRVIVGAMGPQVADRLQAR